MPNNDGEVIFDVRANLEKLPKDLNDAKTSTKKAAEQMESDITDSMEHAAKETKTSTGKITDAMEDVETSAVSAGKAVEKIDADPLDALGEQSVETGESLQQVADSAESASGQINQVADSSSKATGMMGKLSSAASGIGKGLGAAASAGAAVATAVGGAAVATGTFAVNSAVSLDKALNGLAASTGASTDEMEEYETVLKKVYANNYGENFQSIADTMAVVRQQMSGISDTDMQTLTEAAFAFEDISGYSPEESLRAANSLMNQFGVTAEEAYNLMVQGQQQGLDFSGELLDSINEYAPQFEKMGFSAEDMFNIFKSGAESGAFNLDKIGDAVKENAIRVIDLSESTTNAFTALGLDASQMASEFGAGGETAEKAFQKVMVGLQSIEDPVKRNQIGTALWGTMWEDLGETVILSSADMTDSFDQTADSMKKVQDVKYDDLGSMFEGLKRSVEMLVLPLGEELIPLLSDLIQDALPVIEDVLPDVIDLFGEFLEPVLGPAKEALPALTELLTMLMDTTLKQLGEDLLPVLKDAFTTLKEPLEKLITDALPPLIDLFISLMPMITDLAATLLPPLIDVFLALLPPITDLIESLLPPLISLFESIAPILEDLAPVIAIVADGISETLAEAIELVMPIIENIIEILGDLIGFISDVFTGDWESAWDHLVDYFKAVMNWIPITAETVINKFIDLINKMIKGVNKITGVIGIEAISEIDHVTLPRFHTGGVVDFKGKYEDTIIAKDGEMVLTEAQQKRLFDIANGFEYPTGSGGSGQVINQYTTENTEIINNNEFHVRDDSDIERIGEELAALQSRNDAGRGQ